MSTPAKVDLPPLSPEWLLAPLPARDAAAADLDPTDGRFAAMLDLVTKGEYITAGHRAEQAMQDGLLDMRVLGYYLFGYFAERGPAALPVVYRIVQQALGPAGEAIGPREKREIHVENTLQWLFSAMLRNVEHHAKQKDARWQEWLDGKNRPAIDEALELSNALGPVIAQHSAKSRAALRFASLDGWLRGLEPASAAPDARSKETREEGRGERSNSLSIAAPEDAERAEAAASKGDGESDPDGDDDSPAARRRRKQKEKAEQRRRAEEAKRYSLSLDLGTGSTNFSRGVPQPQADDDEDDDDDDDDEHDGDSAGDADASRHAEDEFSHVDEADVEDEDEDPRARAQRGARGFLEDDRETSEASLRQPRGRMQSPAGGPLRIGDESIDASPEWTGLVSRLQAFEQLLQAGEYMKAAVLASDIQAAITSFDPVRYFPSLFAGYLAAFSTHMRPLETCLKESGSVQFKVLQKLYQVSPEEFLRKR
jgi:hypothetical protein